jgi:Ca2+-binding EF-hand superfamily protein
MGNQQYQQRRGESYYTKWNTPHFEQFSGINSTRLPQIQQEFTRVAGTDGLVSQGEFSRLYREFNLGSNDEGSIDRAFRGFDRDRSGKLSFDEFVSASVMLNDNTSARDRVTYLIDSNNPIGVNNTFITPAYGREIISNMNNFYGTNANFDDIWSGLNVNNGQVQREEFVSYVSSAPTFVEYF